MQDRCRAHAMHILYLKQRETQQDSSENIYYSQHISQCIYITVFTTSQMSWNRVSHVSHYSVTLTFRTTVQTTVQSWKIGSENQVEEPGW